MPEERRLHTIWEPRILGVFRVMVGLLYTQHGLNKLFDFPPTSGHHPYVLLTLNPGLAALLEAVGGPLVVLGLFTRWTAFILSGEMAVAYFMVFAPRGFYPMSTGGNLAVLYCFSFFYLFVAGGGAWSLDRLRAPA